MGLRPGVLCLRTIGGIPDRSLSRPLPGIPADCQLERLPHLGPERLTLLLPTDDPESGQSFPGLDSRCVLESSERLIFPR